VSDYKSLKTSEGGENDSFAKPLYGLTPVSGVRIPPLRQFTRRWALNHSRYIELLTFRLRWVKHIKASENALLRRSHRAMRSDVVVLGGGYIALSVGSPNRPRPSGSDLKPSLCGNHAQLCRSDACTVEHVLHIPLIASVPVKRMAG
jgi:hypothetical protein